MIQLNLLPSIKAEYVKAQRTKRTVISLAAIVVISSIGVVGIVASVAYGAQKLQLQSSQKAIEEKVAIIKSTQDLDKILTIQNQLTALTSLHESKPVNERLFGYIQQTTPKDISIANLAINHAESTMNVSAVAPSFEAMNKYVDTIKFTTLDTGVEGESRNAFSEVVLVSFESDSGVFKYTVSFKYDPILFDVNSPYVKLIVPNTITTRSQVEIPTTLFVDENTEESN